MARSSSLWISVLVLLLAAGEAKAAGPVRVEHVELSGLSRTRSSTVLELLPRPPPADYTDAELAEVERRINNLAIFDQVAVERRGPKLHIQVREKWTLIPSVDFATGKTLADAYAMLGLTEYNTLGTANQTGVTIYREQRGWGVAGWYGEHAYRRHRWTFGVEGSLDTAGYRFEDGNGWRSTQGGGALILTSPPSFSDWFNQRLGVAYSREAIDDVRGPTRPPNSHSFQTFLGFSWDRFRWKDLVPVGLKSELVLGAGILVGPAVAQPRHSGELSVIAAVPLSKTTVLMARASGNVRTRGNANFSSLVGSIYGVRGLEDALYRNWIQSFVNVELRQSLPIARRWALQGVLFTDAAVFERVTAAGDRGAAMSAIAAGAGARVIPTWLASTVLRVDGSRLFHPAPRWFVQVGLSQYF